MRWQREADWDDRAGWWFAGYVCGLIAAAVFVICVGGCWTAPAEPTVEYVERVVTPPNLDCRKLPALVGKVPAEPLMLECATGNLEDYHYCRAEQYRRWAEYERDWIALAIAECTP